MDGRAVLEKIKQKGSKATVRFVSTSLADTDQEATLSTYALVIDKETQIGTDQWMREVTALLPATKRELKGCTLTTDKQTYTVVSTVFTLGLIQKVRLK